MVEYVDKYVDSPQRIRARGCYLSDLSPEGLEAPSSFGARVSGQGDNSRSRCREPLRREYRRSYVEA